MQVRIHRSQLPKLMALMIAEKRSGAYIVSNLIAQAKAPRKKSAS